MKKNTLSYLLGPDQEEELDGGSAPVEQAPIQLDEVSIQADPQPEPGTNGPKIEDPSPDQPGGLSRPTAQPAEQPNAQPDQQVDPLPPPPQHIAPPVDPRAQLEQKLLADAAVPEGQSTTQSDPRLEETKPSWYKAIAPPRQKSTVMPDIMKTALGYLLAPSRKAKREAAMQGLGGMIDNISNSKQNQFNTDLDAATKQSQMYRTLNPVSRTNGKGGDTLGTLNYLLHKDQFSAGEAKNKATSERQAREADPTSEESKKAQKALIASGAAEFDQVKDLSAKDIHEQNARFGQSAQRDWSGTEADRRMGNREALHMGREERGQEYALSKEGREQEQSDVEGYVPGYEFVTGHAPDKPSIEKGKELASSLATAREASKKLGELSEKIELATRTGTLYDVFGSDENQKDLKAQAALWGEQLDNANRVIGKYGAPQQGELERMRTYNPTATSLKGLFSGPYLWQAAQGVYDDVEKTQMPLHGYAMPGTQAQGPKLGLDNPSNALPKFEKPPVQPYQKRGTAPTSEFTPKPVKGGPELGLKSEQVFKLKSPSGVVKDVSVTQEMLDHFIKKGFTVVQ